MANAPDTLTFLTVTNEESSLPNSRQLTANPFTSNLQLLDGGPGGDYEIVTTGNLQSLVQLGTSGIVSYNAGANAFAERTLTGDASISVANGDGLAANPVISVNNNTTIQQVNISANGTPVATRATLNFINGYNAAVSVSDDGSNDRCNITVSSTNTGTPIEASYILQQPDALLTNAQALSALDSGVVSVTTGTGVLSSTSYGTNGQVLTSTGSGLTWTTPASSGAPADATYILQTANGSLSNAQALSALSTGLLKSTTGTGVLSTAVSGTDYLAPNATLNSVSSSAPVLGSMLVGNNSGLGEYSTLSPGTNGQVLTINSGSPAWVTPSTGSVVHGTSYFSPVLTNVAIPSIDSGSPNALFTLDTSSYTAPGTNTFFINMFINGAVTWGAGSSIYYLYLVLNSSDTAQLDKTQCIWAGLFQEAPGQNTNASTGYVTVIYKSPTPNPSQIYINQYINGGPTATWSTVYIEAQIVGAVSS